MWNNYFSDILDDVIKNRPIDYQLDLFVNLYGNEYAAGYFPNSHLIKIKGKSYMNQFYHYYFGLICDF